MGYGEDLLMSIVRVFLYFMVIIFILFSMMFLFNVNTSNQFASQCNEIITRSGGLTKSAYAKCNRLSARYYHNYYHVSIKPDLQRSDSDLSQANKGFSDNASYNYQNDSNANGHAWTAQNQDEVPFGHEASYYLYSDVPMYGSLNYHSGRVGKAPIREAVASAVRAGSVTD